MFPFMTAGAKGASRTNVSEAKMLNGWTVASANCEAVYEREFWGPLKDHGNVLILGTFVIIILVY